MLEGDQAEASVTVSNGQEFLSDVESDMFIVCALMKICLPWKLLEKYVHEATAVVQDVEHRTALFVCDMQSNASKLHQMRQALKNHHFRCVEHVGSCSVLYSCAVCEIFECSIQTGVRVCIHVRVALKFVFMCVLHSMNCM